MCSLPCSRIASVSDSSDLSKKKRTLARRHRSCGSGDRRGQQRLLLHREEVEGLNDEGGRRSALRLKRMAINGISKCVTT